MKEPKRIGGALLDALFPRRCPVCSDIVTPGGARICRDCEGVLEYVEEPCCLKCGAPLKDAGEVCCADCSTREHKFDSGRAVFVYNDIMSLSIYGFKYNRRQEYAGFYADEIEKRLGRFIRDLKPDALVPIPLSRKRYIKRGYNQAELISNELSKRIGVPVDADLLVRAKNTKPQKNLSVEERENNLKRAFKIGRNDVSLKTVVLIDDIYTTGSTIDSAAGCLKEYGVKGVYFVVLSTSSML
ncbi:MAG: ComF family protein [Lachnospiraceae bacterium]|nr:ComF family protein [Lachnospiraceae bacterium]HAV00741.1 amidophosphoribosyltransferase [Lachnospiraceae bacterium]